MTPTLSATLARPPRPRGQAPAVRNHLTRIKPLIIFPPYLGEFGWELMNWQARVRWLLRRRSFETAIIACAPDRAALYRDMARARPGKVRLVEVALDDVPGQPSEDHRVDAQGRRVSESALKHFCLHALRRARVSTEDALIHWPDFRGTLWSTEPAAQHFIPFGRAAPIEYDVLLVPRAPRGPDAAARLPPPDWWIDLAGALASRGLCVATYRPPLDNAVRQLSAVRLAVGGSTGGLHLAMLCRCPHYVWGPGRESRWTAIAMTNRQRYETIWNPLATPVLYDPLGWTPAVAVAAAGILDALDRIGRCSASRRAALARRARWSIHRRLARLWARGPREGRTPWRIREFIREKTA